MNAPLPGTAAAFAFEIDGRPVTAHAGETLLQVAQRHGVGIPHLCFKEGYRADGNCRACVVEIEGERVLAASCCRQPAPGMKVQVDSPRAQAARRGVLELLLADVPEPQPGSELARWADGVGARARRYEERAQPAADLSHPAIAVQLDACIQCGRCVRACREEQVNDVIGYAGRGDGARIVFDLDDPMGASSCVGCGECVQACPTGALAPRLPLGGPDGGEPALPAEGERHVESLCPFCGVGCQLSWVVADGRIRRVEGRDGPANHGRLCVKGRFGFDYVHSPQRLTQPLVRRPDRPKRLPVEGVPVDVEGRHVHGDAR